MHMLVHVLTQGARLGGTSVCGSGALAIARARARSGPGVISRRMHTCPRMHLRMARAQAQARGYGIRDMD